MNQNLLSQTLARVAAAKQGQPLPTRKSAQNETNGTEVIPSTLHLTTAAILIARDLEERKTKGLGVLSLMDEADPDGWKDFKRKNPTVTMRLEDRSEPGFPRFVTGYASGSVVFQNVVRLNRTGVEKVLETLVPEPADEP